LLDGGLKNGARDVSDRTGSLRDGNERPGRKNAARRMIPGILAPIGKQEENIQ